MKAKCFTWHYAARESPLFPEGATIEFVSYSAAARGLGVSESVIRYYQAQGIHSSKDKRKKQRKS